LRGYELQHRTVEQASTVEYATGKTRESAARCNLADEDANDYTGLLREVVVSKNSPTFGYGTGDIYRRRYRWTGDLVSNISSCTLDAPARQEAFAYDKKQRLTGATGTQSTTGGTYNSREFTYRSRDRMATQEYDSCTNTMTDHTTQKDRLYLHQATTCDNGNIGSGYGYDKDGRLDIKFNAYDSTGGPSDQWTFAHYVGGLQATESLVFGQATTTMGVYDYYYDAKSRRRARVLPTWAFDEMYHDLSDHLLTERGNETVLGTMDVMMDDYVWLDGRPVIVIRGRFGNEMYAREDDTSTDCGRNDENWLPDGGVNPLAPACGERFIITDHLAKPVLMLDSSRQIAGVADYDPLGFPNRVSVQAGTDHPYDTSGSVSNTFWGLAEPSTADSASLIVDARVRFHMVDTEGANEDYVDLQNSSGVLQRVQGPHLGSVVSSWHPMDGLEAKFTANALNATNCHPDDGCGVDDHWPYAGASIDSYEYRRYQSGAQPFWVPLRFPGQYYDEETDLHENWNRYYDPSIGAYTQPEPLMSNPGFVRGEARRGFSAPAYAYARSNPVNVTDPTGRNPAAGALAGGASAVGAAASLAASVWCLANPKACDEALQDAWRRTKDFCREAAKPKKPNCKKQKVICVTQCVAEALPTGEYSGDPFYKCVYDCMEAAGCK
nr:RHS repeat-associated core domain-containing protein [Gemmatimonadaceae bacterium]